MFRYIMCSLLCYCVSEMQDTWCFIITVTDFLDLFASRGNFLTIYTPCPKKGSHQTFGNNFVKSRPIFKILSLLNKGWIFPTKLRNIFHHTLIMLLHYLGKVNSSNLLQITTEKIKKCVVFDKNETFMLSCSWLEIGVLFYSVCSKCPPFACTHARKRLCHSSMHCL